MFLKFVFVVASMYDDLIVKIKAVQDYNERLLSLLHPESEKLSSHQLKQLTKIKDEVHRHERQMKSLISALETKHAREESFAHSLHPGGNTSDSISRLLAVIEVVDLSSDEKVQAFAKQLYDYSFIICEQSYRERFFFSADKINNALKKRKCPFSVKVVHVDDDFDSSYMTAQNKGFARVVSVPLSFALFDPHGRVFSLNGAYYTAKVEVAENTAYDFHYR